MGKVCKEMIMLLEEIGVSGGRPIQPMVQWLSWRGQSSVPNLERGISRDIMEDVIIRHRCIGDVMEGIGGNLNG